MEVQLFHRSDRRTRGASVAVNVNEWGLAAQICPLNISDGETKTLRFLCKPLSRIIPCSYAMVDCFLSGWLHIGTTVSCLCKCWLLPKSCASHGAKVSPITSSIPTACRESEIMAQKHFNVATLANGSQAWIPFSTWTLKAHFTVWDTKAEDASEKDQDRLTWREAQNRQDKQTEGRRSGSLAYETSFF